MTGFDDGSHMSWGKAMVTDILEGRRVPTIAECLELFDVDEWCWSNEQYADQYTKWAVNPHTGETKPFDVANRFLAVQVVE